MNKPGTTYKVGDVVNVLGLCWLDAELYRFTVLDINPEKPRPYYVKWHGNSTGWHFISEESISDGFETELVPYCRTPLYKILRGDDE